MPNARQFDASRARWALYSGLRAFFGGEGYEEVDTPLLVPTPGMEPHITAFGVHYEPETGVGRARELFLHTSPEYAMKRLLADGAGPIFQLCKVFRNGEVTPAHNPEFTMLEFYRPNADYRRIMADLEGALAAGEARVGRSSIFSKTPYERVTVRDALLRATGVDLRAANDAPKLRRELERLGIRAQAGDSFDDLFFRVFLDRVERTLGADRPTFLVDYPASMASLARLSPADPSVAERFELYVHGLELANGFSELTDGAEQRRRLIAEQNFRRSQGRRVYELDERFIDAVGRLPPCSGVAVGMDRILMLMLRTERIDDVLLFPARDFLEEDV